LQKWIFFFLLSNSNQPRPTTSRFSSRHPKQTEKGIKQSQQTPPAINETTSPPSSISLS